MSGGGGDDDEDNPFNVVNNGLKTITTGIKNVVTETDKGFSLIDGRAQRAAEKEAKKIKQQEEARREDIRQEQATRKSNQEAKEKAAKQRSTRVSSQKKQRSSQIITDNLGTGGGQNTGTKNLLGL